MSLHSFSASTIAIHALFAMNILLVGQAARSGELTAECPSEIDEGSWRPVSVPEKWVGQMANGMRLQSGGMMLGPPNSRAYLAPEKHKIVGDELTNWYSLGNLDGEKWFYCDYSGTHAVQLYRRMDDSVRQCVAKFSGLNIVRKLTVTCK